MDYRSLFYWFAVADNAKAFFVTFIVIFTAIATIATIGYFINAHTDSAGGQTESDREGQRMSRKWMFWSYPFMVLFWALYVFTPSKKDALLIVGGGGTLNYLTQDSTAKQIPHEFLTFVKVELQNMAKDAKVELGIQSQKDKILEQAKSMSAQELIDKMKTDTTLAKIILNQ